MQLKEFEELRIGDLVVSRAASGQSGVYPVSNINRQDLRLHIGKTGKWRSFLQFDVLTTDYIVKFIKRKLNARGTSYLTIDATDDTVIIKIHKEIK